MSLSVSLFAITLLGASPSVDAPATAAPAALANPPELAVTPLAAGRTEQALVTLEAASAADPHDAAVLINLGIAYAHAGDDAKARAAFEQALACHQVIELDTADGTTTDSRRLARKALKMLERGEFRPVEASAGQLTYRDR
jgi:tetratricopeptide (TPR) repeat protein